MDTAHWRQVPDPEASLRVLATVLTQKGQTVVLDAGRKTLGTIDPIPPIVRDVPGPIRMFHEEHLAIETDCARPYVRARSSRSSRATRRPR